MTTIVVELLASSVPVLAALAGTGAACLAVLGMLARPHWMAYAYLALLLCVTGNSYGSLDAEAGQSIYGRGSGVLLYPLVLWAALGALLLAWFSNALARRDGLRHDLGPWFLAFTLLLAAHAVVGVLDDVALRDALGPMGFSLIAWMWVPVALLMAAFGEANARRDLQRFFVIVGLGRALFGLLRWALWGGDPANIYANSGNVSIRLTFFDINDGLVCILCAGIAAARLLNGEAKKEGRGWQALYMLAVVCAFACIVLSFRRTAWAGLGLAGLFLLTRMPIKQRMAALVSIVPVALMAIVYTAHKRLSQTRGTSGGLESFFYDVQPSRVGPESARLLELRFSFADFLDHPLLGIGAWGRYKGHELIPWQTGPESGQFLHSGILHLALKSGLLGVALFVGLWFFFARASVGALRHAPASGQPFAVAGVMGALFILPDFLIGTPIPQVRTMQMIAVVLALPYLAWANGTSGGREGGRP